jgi:hypothetical protein
MTIPSMREITDLLAPLDNERRRCDTGPPL